MPLWTYFKYAVSGLAGIIVIGEIYHYLALKIKEKSGLYDDDEEEINEIVFTQQPVDMQTRLTKAIRFQREPSQYSIELIENLIQSARRSIHIAMYIFTSEPISQALAVAHARGVEVLVVVDHSMETASRSQIPRLQGAGITIRISHDSTMHHKLCLIDVPYDENKKKLVAPQSTPSLALAPIRYPKNGVAITGSLNWTRDALLSNRENFLVTSNENVCECSAVEFFDLWNTSRSV